MPAHAARLRQQAEILRDRFGFDVDFLDRVEVTARLGIERQHGALLYPGVPLIDPWSLCQALKSSLLVAGVRIVENTQVTRVTGGDPATLVAAGHTVTAGRIAVTTDGFTLALGLFPGKIAAIRTRVVRTDVIAPELLTATGWGGDGAVIDSRNFFNYFRLTGRRRLLFGGGPAVLDHRARQSQITSIRSRLVRELATTFPALAGVPVTEFWSGVTASAFDRMPIVGPVPGHAGVWFAGAWCGHGLALSALAGDVLAPHVTGERAWTDRDRDLIWLRDTAGWMPSGPIGDALLGGYLRGLDGLDRLAAASDRTRQP